MNGLLNQYQGMTPSGGLLGNTPMSGAPASIQPLLGNFANPSTPGVGGNPLLSQMGPWSQMAYRMAGSPLQGPYPSVPVPPASPAGGSSLGLAAGLLGLLGAKGSNSGSSGSNLNQTISLGRNLYNGIQGLLNPSTINDPAALAQASDAAVSQGTAPVSPLMSTPAQAGITTPDGPLYSGATNANADLAAQEANAYAANGGLLGAVGGTGVGTRVADTLASTAADQGIASAATGALADSTPYVAATGADAPAAAAAYGGAAGSAAGGAAGGAVTAGEAATGSDLAGGSIAGPLLGAGLLYQLEQGLTSPGFSSSTGYAINQDLGNFTGTVAPWLNSVGPGLAYMSGDGSAQYPLTAVLKNGTQLNQDQMNQLHALYKQGYLQANPNTYSTHSDFADHPTNMTLPADITAQMQQILSQASAVPGGLAGYGQPSQQGNTIAQFANLTPQQIAQLQAGYGQYNPSGPY